MAELRIYVQYDWPYDDRFVYRRIRYDDQAHTVTAIEPVFLEEVEGTTMPIIKENEWKQIYKAYSGGEKRYLNCRGVGTEIEVSPLTSAYTQIGLTAVKTDISGYKENNGSIQYTITGGTGELINFYHDKGGAAKTAHRYTRNFTGLEPGQYTGRAVDSGDGREIILQNTIIEPACNLLIGRIDSTPETAPAQNDGTITIEAQSANAMEYRLEGPTPKPWTTFASGAAIQFTGLANGTYTVNVRDINQPLCLRKKFAEVGELSCETAIQAIEVIHESYTGKADGQIIITAYSNRAMEYRIEGAPLQEIPWQESGHFLNLAPGSYDILVRDKDRNQCEDRGYALIKPGDSFRADITNIVCGGSATGRMHINRNNSIAVHGPHTFSWPDGSTEQKRNDLRAGSHTVTITNKRGVSTQITGTITENPPIVVLASIDQNDIYLTVSGGVSPYTFLWSDGSTAQNRLNLTDGTYTVTVTDSLGCKKTESIFLRIPQHYFSENPIPLDVYAVDLHLKPNFKFVCEVWIEPEYLSGNFIRVAELEQDIDENGKTVFEVEDYLNTYLEAEIPEIHSGVKRLNKQFKRFYLKYTEKYGNPPEISGFTEQETFYVALGGLNYEEVATKDFFSHYIPEQKPFYTWMPLEKEVFPDQPEFLYFMIHDRDLTEFRVHCVLHYQSGEEQTHEVYRQAGVKQYELYSVAVGFDQLSLSAYKCGAPPFMYEIYITNPAGVEISERRSYYVNNEYFPQKRFFFFLNSLGCFDTLAATGKAVYDLRTQREKAEKWLPYNYAPTDRDFEIVNKYGEMEVNIPLGFVNKNLLDRLQDFIISKEYFLFEKGRLLPVDIEINRATVLNEEENLHSLEFSYYPPRLQKFTPKLKQTTPEVLSAHYAISPATIGMSNGSITITPEGGSAPYTYLWNDGATTKDRANIPAGTYSVRISDNSSPRKVYSVCNLIIEEHEATGPTYTYTIWPHYTEDPAFYYATAPGFKYTLASTSARSVGQLLIRGMNFPIGITRISFYVYLPAAFQFGKTIPEITAEFSGVGSSYTKVTSGVASSRGVWQRIVIDAKVTKDVTHDIFTKVEIDNNGDTPHYWLSDLTFQFLS